MLCSYSIQYINFFFAIFLKEEKILFHHNSTPLIITLLCVLLNKLILLYTKNVLYPLFFLKVLREKLCNFKPKIAVFNGKAIYEVYSGQKKFMFGRQPEPLNDGATWLWVMPSSSARCAQLPRAVDKVPFFEALRKFRDYLTGKLAKIEDCEVVFANVSLRNWTAIKTDSTDTDDINPNLQPYCDGVPANVPLSVCEVIEDVIRQYSLDGGPGPTDQTSSSSVPNTPVSACSQNSMHPPLGSEESDCNTVGSVGSSNSNM